MNRGLRTTRNRGKVIEHITGNQDSIDLVLGGKPSQSLHRCDAGLGQQGGMLRVERGVKPADLPVGSVEEFWHTCCFFENIVSEPTEIHALANGTRLNGHKR